MEVVLCDGRVSVLCDGGCVWCVMEGVRVLCNGGCIV